MEKTEPLVNSLDQTAKRFISRGTGGESNPAVLAASCERIIRTKAESSLDDALVLARQFLRQVEKSNLNGPLSVAANRVAGVIFQFKGLYRDSRKRYLRARSLAKKDPLMQARIDRALVDVYMYLGRFGEARQRALNAMSVFRRLRLPLDVARTEVNYASVMHRQDRHRDAEKWYSRAAGVFESSGDELALARCQFNRANSLLQLFKVDQAEGLYSAAKEIYERHGHIVSANDASYSLAWLRMLVGKYHVALLELTECERVYRESGQLRGVALCELDRAEVYLSLHLFSDAKAASILAAKQFAKLEIRYEGAKASYFLAQAEAALGNEAASRRALSCAKKIFTAENNLGFLAASYLLAAQNSKTNVEARRILLKSRAAFTRAQLPLWEGVCDVSLTQVPDQSTAALQRLSRNSATSVVPQLYSAWRTAQGDSSFRRGRKKEAQRYWCLAADRLDAVRAALPPVEFRSALDSKVSHGTPHTRLIKAAIHDSPLEAAIWSERYKTAGLWAPITNHWMADPARVKVEKSLGELASQVAALSRVISGGKGERAVTAESFSGELARLKRRIRTELSAIESRESSSPDSPSAIAHILAEAASRCPVVQFHLAGDDIVAFIHHQKTCHAKVLTGGRKRLEQGMRVWRFLLERELLTSSAGERIQARDEDALFSDLGEWLWKPLGLSGEKRVLLIPEGELTNIPWPALKLGVHILAAETDIIMAPSVRHHHHSLASENESAEIQVFAGSADDLPHVSHEVSRLATRAGENCRIHSRATRADISDAGSARLWHYAGHAHIRPDNPFYSSLAMADGPLFAVDFRLKNTAVNLVTLAACRGGQEISLPGEESTGLVRSLLEMGARNVIAGRWPVADASTAVWMNFFYERYFAGEPIYKAVTAATLSTREKYASAYHWSAFAVFGAGE